MERLVIVSNRLPLKIIPTGKTYKTQQSTGGLATAMGSLRKTSQSPWIGWVGKTVKSQKDQARLQEWYNQEGFHPLFLDPEDVKKFYEGFCNRTIWPLFHYFVQTTDYRNDEWEAYQRINQVFAEETAKLLEPDDLVWIHDYHLLLMPKMLRDLVPNAKIGFFLHIPFPSFETFRTLPWRNELIEGMLGADLLGFHTLNYSGYFLEATERILGHKHEFSKIHYGNRYIKASAYPIGIDFEKYSNSTKNKVVRREIKTMSKTIKGEKKIISIGRMDYTKGILQSLQGFEAFLERYPEYHGKVTFIIVAVPSRQGVEAYQNLRRQVDELVGRMNGQYGNLSWTPVHYFYRGLPFPQIAALYKFSDTALIIPYRDGMNLVAKEFVASKQDKKGVLILSETTGAVEELAEAVIVNPNNIIEIADTIKASLEMPVSEQKRRIGNMRKIVETQDVFKWGMRFLAELKDVNAESTVKTSLQAIEKKEIFNVFRQSRKCLLFIDYDGTLVPFYDDPKDAKPDSELRTLLERLQSIPKVQVVLVSGRQQGTLSDWFKDSSMIMFAEHGAWMYSPKTDWHYMAPRDQSWKEEIRPVLDMYTERQPGSFIEDKKCALAWHYRTAHLSPDEERPHELVYALEKIIGDRNLNIIHGNHVIEIRDGEINKGVAVQNILGKFEHDFVFAVGDDVTDEDMFRVMPSSAFTLKVGNDKTAARFQVDTYQDVRRLLKTFTEIES